MLIYSDDFTPILADKESYEFFYLNFWITRVTLFNETKIIYAYELNTYDAKG